MTQTLTWLLNLDRPIPGGGPEDTYRQGYEKQLNEHLSGVKQLPEWALKDITDKLSPPSIEPLLEAETIAEIEGGTDWVSMQFMMFLELSRQRGRNQVILPISFTDLDAYQRLNKIELHPVEVNNILALDQIFINFASDVAQEQLAAAKKA